MGPPSKAAGGDRKAEANQAIDRKADGDPFPYHLASLQVEG
jgi:hypothetical protein